MALSKSQFCKRTHIIKKIDGKKFKRIKTYQPNRKYTHTVKYVEFQNFKNPNNFPKLIKNFRTLKIFYHIYTKYSLHDV
jgi:hypothetical protein